MRVPHSMCDGQVCDGILQPKVIVSLPADVKQSAGDPEEYDGKVPPVRRVDLSLECEDVVHRGLSLEVVN